MHKNKVLYERRLSVKISIRDVRAGNSQSRYNDSAINFFIFELLVLSIAVGIGKSSWYWGGGTLLGGMIIIYIPIVNIFFSLLMTYVWGVIGYQIGEAIGQEGANWMIAIIAALISLGAHLGAMEWVQDINRTD